MNKFDSNILEEIREVLLSSYDLLDIESWAQFELDCSIPIESKAEVFLSIKNGINDYANIAGIYAIFDGETCLYIGKGKRIWERIKSHYKAARGVDGTAKWDAFFQQYQKKLIVCWVEYKNLEQEILDDKLRELFEHVLQSKYKPKFDVFRY